MLTLFGVASAAFSGCMATAAIGGLATGNDLAGCIAGAIFGALIAGVTIALGDWR